MAHTIRNLSGIVTIDVDGSDETDKLVAVSTNNSTELDCGTATVHFSTVPSGADPEAPIVIYANSTPIFNGFIRRRSYPFYKNSVAFACTDIQENITRAWGGAGTDPELDALLNRWYENQTADAVKVNVMEAMAVGLLHVVNGPDTWTLGTIEPVVLRVGQTPLQLIRSLDELEGTWTATQPIDGAIYNYPIALGTPAATYTEGSNIFDFDLDIFGADTIRNKCIVYGLQTPVLAIGGVGVGEYSVANADVPAPIDYQTTVFRTNLVEDDTTALDFATAYVGRHNFRHERGRLVIKGREDHLIGDTITVVSSRNNINGDRFVTGITQEFNNNVGWKTTLTFIRVA